MAFTTSSAAATTTTSPLASSAFFGQNVASGKLHSPPTSVKFPPRRPSATATTAAYVSSSTERTRLHVAAPPPSSGGSLYDVLGIEAGATCQEIKAAYRRLARVVHPDVKATTTNGQSRDSSYEFMKVHEAYATLSDPAKRADYDRILLMHRLNSSLAMTPSMAGVSRSTASRYGGYARRNNWETDQCW